MRPCGAHGSRQQGCPFLPRVSPSMPHTMPPTNMPTNVDALSAPALDGDRLSSSSAAVPRSPTHRISTASAALARPQQSKTSSWKRPVPTCAQCKGWLCDGGGASYDKLVI